MAAKKTDKSDNVVTEDKNADDVLDNEIERILPEPGDTLTLEDGTEVVLRPLKVKELLAAFKIITRGSVMGMGAMSNTLMGQDQDHFAEALIALILNAFPEADVEVAEFIRIVVDPVPPNGKWENKQERLDAEVHLDNLLLDNPEIGDAIDIITALIYQEAQDIQRLGKKISGAAKLLQKITPKTSEK